MRSRAIPPLHTIHRAKTGEHQWHLKYADEDRQTQISGKIPIHPLLSEIAHQAGMVFDDVLLANSKGMIVYQRKASEFRFTNLKSLFATKVETSWLSALFSLAAEGTSTSNSKTEQSQEIMSPAHLQVTPGGSSYELFVQPVLIPNLVHGEDNGEGESNTWFLCGLTSTNSFRGEYLAIPFTYLLLFVFALVTVFLGLPLLSLALMDTRERLTRFSVFSLILTAFLWATTLTFFILDVSIVRAIKERISEQLQTTAQAIHDGFQIELNRILWQLNDYDKKITGLKDINTPNTPKKDRVAWVARNDIPDPCQESPDRPSPWCFPHYSIMFWADEQGDLRVNWTPQGKRYIHGVHSLRHRDYVSVIQERTLPLMKRQVGDSTIPFYIQPIITLESSERTIVISKPHEQGQPGVTPWVAAIQPDMLSILKTPALPSGTGYAVIHNDDGMVLFHSEAKRSFRENFFEETDRNEALQALTYSRAADSFEGEYWGKGHQFYVMPFQGLPWSLVVFQDKEILRAHNFEILLFAGFLFLLYFLMLAVFCGFLIGVVGRQARKHWRRWIWPNSRYRNQYIGIVLWNLLVAIGMTITMMWIDVPPAYEYLLSVGIPALSFILLCTGLWALRPIPSQDASGSHPIRTGSPFSYGTEGGMNSLYSWMMLSFLLVFAIVPVGNIFSIAHREETDLLMKHHLFTLGQSLIQTQHTPLVPLGEITENGIFQYYPRVTSSSEANMTPLIPDCQSPIHDKPNYGMLTGFSSLSSGIPEHQLSSTQINYILNGILKDGLTPTHLCFGRLHSPMSDEENPAPVFIQRIHKLVRSSSLQSSPILETWGFIQDGTRQNSFKWNVEKSNEERRLSLMLENFPQQRQGASEFTSTGTLILSAEVPFSLWMLPLNATGWWIGVLGGLLVLFLLLRFAIYRTFPLQSHIPKWGMSHLPQEPYKIKSPQNFLVVSPPGTGKSVFAHSQLQHWEVIDLRMTTDEEHWSNSILKDLGRATKGKSTIALDHFEYKLGQPQHDHEKRNLVEGLLMSGHQVYILSSVNLLHHSFSLTPQTQNDSPPSGPTHSDIDWGYIFQSFLLLYFSEPGTPQLIQETIIQKTEPSIPSQLSDQNPIVQAFQTECGPTAHLRSLGQWIRQRTEWIAWSPDQLVANVLRLSKPYYYTLWKSCSLEEKMALFHIAKDGFVHSAHQELPMLHQKGLIRFTPQIQIMNESFNRYILLAADREDLITLERTQSPNTWSRLKLPLLLGVGLLILFMFATQQEFKNSLLALLSLLPVILPAFPELPSFLSASKLGESSEA